MGAKGLSDRQGLRLALVAPPALAAATLAANTLAAAIVATTP